VVGAGHDAIAQFVTRWLAERGAPRAGPESEGPINPRLIRARELLELERDTLRMFTSCGWFFDDVAGIETAQVLKYAARAIELAGSGSSALTAELLEHLARARGNDPAVGTGREVYQRVVRKSAPAPARAAAAYAAVRALAPAARPESGCFMPQEDQGVGETDGDGSGRKGTRREVVTLRHCRTGRVHRFRVRLEAADGPRLVGVVAGPDGGNEARVPLAEFPERPRELVRAALRRRLVARWLTPEQTARVADGEALLSDVAAQALSQAVAALANGERPGQADEVYGLADLLELLGHGVPFDAQTRFARIRDQASPERAAALAPIRRRLGFA
jgi:hypothetical protein